jgi:Holliday junction DNA helicase RuvB
MRQGRIHNYAEDSSFAAFLEGGEEVEAIAPVAHDERTRNPLRPSTFDDMIGQVRLRSMLRRVIEASNRRDVPMAHTLLVGPSGTGKSTIANIIGNELGVSVFQVEAPVSHETLLSLRTTMRDGDILFIDEVHQQAAGDRRGRSTSTQPEVLFNVMEDRTLVSGMGVLPFPAVTVVAATTDEGMLPDAFVNRFPFRPVIERYTVDDLTTMAFANALVYGLTLDFYAAEAFAAASRGVPRVLNNYVTKAQFLAEAGIIDADLADEVVRDFDGTTPDGLTPDMQAMLKFIFQRGRQQNKETGEVTYKASVLNIATGIGKSRDAKAIQLRVEPYLIEQGFVQVAPNGRRLTDQGIHRAEDLLNREGVR